MTEYNILAGHDIEREPWKAEERRTHLDAVSKRLFHDDTEDDSRCVKPFPEQLEAILRPFDDAIIAWVQTANRPGCRWKKFAVGISMLFTFFTAIEIGLSIPFLLLSLQFDVQAIICLYVMLLFSISTQLFKRFVWRNRPFVVDRAELRSKELKTSSFPSRAVVGGVIYAALGSFFLESRSGDFYWGIRRWQEYLFCGFIAAITSYARIYLGVHFPSDCIAGCFLGFFIFECGIGLASAQWTNCDCRHLDDDHEDGYQDAKDEGIWIVLTIGCLISVVLFAVMICPPITFWNKGTHAFALLLPTLVFLLAFRCPALTMNNKMPWGMKHKSHASLNTEQQCLALFYTLFISIAAFSTQKLQFIMKTATRQLCSFIIVFTASLLVLIFLRM